MKVKCPHCDYKGEALDGKCPVCDFPLEVKSSLLMKFRSMNIATKAVTVFFLLFVAILIISSIISLMSNHKKEIYMHTKTIQSSGTIDGFLSVNWGDSIEVAAQKLSSSGYEIKDIDYIKKNIRLKPIILAGHKTSESEVGVLCFYSKGFYSGWVVFTPDSTNIEKAKEEIAYVIGQKYGHPSSKDSSLLVWESSNKCMISLLRTNTVLLKYDSRAFIYDDVDTIKSEGEAIKASLKNHQKQLSEEMHKKKLDQLKGLEKQF